MSANGHTLSHDLLRLDDRVDRLETHVEALEIEHKHTRSALDGVRGDLKEASAEVKALRILAERAIGAGVALGLVWTVVTFVVAMLFRR